ncbi:MAG: transposase [Cyclobacteriaceae bacterium]|nr:transposase [Cyclobacteriaceae bacterium]
MVYYKSKRNDQPVIDAVLELANKHPRYGCPTITKMIRRQHRWNHKRIERIYGKLDQVLGHDGRTTDVHRHLNFAL